MYCYYVYFVYTGNDISILPGSVRSLKNPEEESQNGQNNDGLNRHPKKSSEKLILVFEF